MIEDSRVPSYHRYHTKKPDTLRIFPDIYPWMDHLRPHFLLAQRMVKRAEELGFAFKKAGLTVPIDTPAVSESALALGHVLETDMVSGIPHFFVTLTPTRKKHAFPSAIGRSYTTADSEPDGSRASIVHELIQRNDIKFHDHPPFCTYNPIDENGSVEPYFRMHFWNRLDQINRDWNLSDTHITLLAGIGRVFQESATYIRGEENAAVFPVSHGSTAVDLARIVISFLAWSESKPTDPLYMLSTTRLTNEEQASPPQAYLLHRLFNRIGLQQTWFGLCCARMNAIREHDTGAVLVEIQPKEIEQTRESLHRVFNEAVDTMVHAKENVGLFE